MDLLKEACTYLSCVHEALPPSAHECSNNICSAMNLHEALPFEAFATRMFHDLLKPKIETSRWRTFLLVFWKSSKYVPEN